MSSGDLTAPMVRNGMIFDRLLDALNTLARTLAGLLLAVTACSIALQIVVRTGVNHLGFAISLPWTEEVARYAFIWSIFLGMPTLCRRFGMISVDALPELGPQWLARPVRVVALLVSIGFFAVLVLEGIGFTQMTTAEYSTVLRIPTAWIYVSLPVGGCLAIINLVACLFDVLTGRQTCRTGTDHSACALED